MKIEELEKQQKELLESVKRIGKQIEELKNPKPEFEVGKWYKSPNIPEFICNYQGTDEGNFSRCFGFNCNGDWNDVSGLWHLKGCVPATESEVKEALIKEAERRGFKGGIEIEHEEIGTVKKLSLTNRCWSYTPHDDSLYYDFGSDLIYHKGQWAEIVKEEEIKIGGYPVVFKNGSTSIDGHEFTKEFWQSALLISQHSKAKVKVGCSHQFDLDTETINKILSKL